jgi:rubrerythrin
VLKVLLRGVWKIETYAKDAEEEGDTELAQWFRKVQDFDRAAAAEGKQLLLRRLQKEGR